MTTMNIRKFTSRNTKTDILKGYNELAKAYREIESKPAPAAARPSVTKALAKVSTTSAGALDVAGVIAQLSSLSDRIGESAGSLQQKLTFEATNLEELLEESAGRVSRLQALHTIEFGEDCLDRIIATYREAREKHDAQLTDKQDAFAKDIAARRDDWRKEQDDHGRKVKERIVELKKTRTRDNQEYKYELALRRGAEDDAVAQGQKAFDKQLADAREAKEEQWAAREKEIAGLEAEFAELKEKKEAFPKALEKAIKAAESMGMSIARRKTKVDADLLAKESEGRERVFKLRVKSLEETLKKQNDELKSLSAQLESTSKRAEDLTVRAIEGASNASSFKAIQDIAMEQAKYSGKGK
jgi:chromosome segregation ATPase